MYKLEQSVVDSEGSNIINVCRERVLDGAIRGFSRTSFDPCKPLSVKFVGEDAIDEGGPSREFFRLAVREIQEMPIFQGESRCRMIVLDAAS